jgi:hypothetical protein
MGDAPKEELYDLDADPWAVKNLIADPVHADALAKMRKDLTEWRTFSEDTDVHPKAIPRSGGK